MKSILSNKSHSMNVRKRVFKCYIGPSYLGRKSWNVNKQISENLEITELWFFFFFFIPLTSKVTNNDFLKMTNQSRTLYIAIRSIQISSFSYIMKSEALENEWKD